MKRTLLILLPWMAAVVSAQDALRPAEVTLTHLGSAPAWRQGDVCYVNPSALIGWKWPYSFVGNEATIQAEGRTVRVIGKTINTRFVLPLNEILDQLGASYAWRSDRDVLEAWASVRSVKVQNGMIQADATLSVAPDIFWMDQPGRIVIDLKGARLADNVSATLDPKARIGQMGPSTVRIVLETDTKPLVPTFASGRTFEWNLGGPPSEGSKPIGEPTQDTPKLNANVHLAGIEVLSESDSGAALRLTTTAPLPAPAQLRRVDPVTLEIELPKVGPGEATLTFKTPSVTEWSKAVTATSTILRLVLARPMGIRFSSSANQMSLELIKPKVGDGKLAGKVIVIDPGHGAHDSGARSPGKDVVEKNLTLAIGTLIASELTSQGATVIQTRANDTFIELKERAEIANRNGASFFVSVHINSNRVNDTASGTITFHHGGSVTSQLLAECIQNEIKQIDRMPAIGVWSDTKIYSTGFAVLRYSKMPAVLLELGFINNSKDRKRMQELDYQQAVARAVAKGIRVFLGDVKP